MEPHLDLIALLGIVFAGLGLFLSTFYLLRNQLKNDGYLFLYLSLAIVSYEVFYKTLIHSRLIYDFVALYSGRRFFNLLIYPIFLFFTWTVTRKEFRLKLPHIGVLALFAAYALYSFAQGLLIPANEKKQLLDLFYADTRPGPYNYWGNWTTLIKSTLIPVGLLSIIGYDFFQFRRKPAKFQSRHLLNLLTLIIVLYFSFNQFSNLLYQLFYDGMGYSMIEWPVDIICLSLIVVLLSIIALSVNAGDSFFPPAKYAKSSIDASAYEEIIRNAKSLIEKERLFKQQQLTIGQLAKRINTNPKYLSQSVNDYMGLSFVDFINQYRIEEAKKLLLDENNKSLTIEAIGQMAGFKSKSSFFRAFKKFTQLTPNQYLKSQDSASG